MKEKILKTLAFLAEKSIKNSSNSTCIGWTYQPKEPVEIADFNNMPTKMNGKENI